MMELTKNTTHREHGIYASRSTYGSINPTGKSASHLNQKHDPKAFLREPVDRNRSSLCGEISQHNELIILKLA